MDDEALQRIENDLYEIAEFLGQPEALSNHLYFRRTFDGAERQPMELRERVLEKIKTLDRILSLHDIATYNEAMENIARATRYSVGPTPERVVLLLDEGDELNAGRTWNPAELPDLSEPRALLRSLSEDVSASNRQ